MNLDGSNPTRITNNAACEVIRTGPRMLPESSSPATRTPLQRDDNDLYVMQADGSGELRLTMTPKGRVLRRWSPQGDLIVFEG